MDGALYTATEIVVFLVIATLIGVVLGRLWGGLRRPSEGGEGGEEESPAAAESAGLRSELAEARRQLGESEAEAADLRKQLSVVEWQVTTLEEELAGRPHDED